MRLLRLGRGPKCALPNSYIEGTSESDWRPTRPYDGIWKA